MADDAPPAEAASKDAAKDATKDLPDPSHPDFTYESSPHLYLFTSLTAGSSQILTATSRLETILKAHRIPFHAIDAGTDDKARKIWARRAGGRKLPGLVKDGYVVADLPAVEEWNEYGELKDMLGARGEGGAARPVVLGGATPVTGKENAKAMAKAGYGVGGPAAEGIDTSGAAKSRIGAFEKRTSLGGEQQVQQKQSALAAEAAAMGSVRANRAKFEAAGGGGGGPAMFKRRIPSGAPKSEALGKKDEASASIDQPAATEAAKMEDKTTSDTKTSDTLAETTTVKPEDTTTSSEPSSATATSEPTTAKPEDTTTSSTAAADTAAAADPTTANTDDITTASTPSANLESTAEPATDIDPATDTTPTPAAPAPSTTTPAEEPTAPSKPTPHTTFDTKPPHTSSAPLPEADPMSMASSPPLATAAIALPAIPKDELLKQSDPSPAETAHETTQEAESEAPAIMVLDAETGEERDAEAIAKENDLVAVSAGGSQHVHFKGEPSGVEPSKKVEPSEEKEPSQEETKVLEEKLEGVDIKAAEEEQKEDEKTS